MTQKTKLEIIGPYTPEHEGPFCTRDGRPIRIVCSDMKNGSPIIGIISNEDGVEAPCNYSADGKATYGKAPHSLDLMNAREAPVAREFWVNKYKFRELSGAYPTKGMADSFSGRDRVECIHVREVLPGEGA
ncbi:hypothetical protein [Acetobacter cerevisiae]|uniref:Uncharacterized protein n=1 Tax=Acetobacter cerevisiae TaxID=178900 RepID=A0A149QVY3_9PROT|nr:hypothetical protein [Acetobacter cerevisiae]KXV01465.1 hypothetical protein AD928_01525 [Acetobacter cerevisiae]GBQ10464.1 hypothetical protein AA14362_2557 [Acetobacter cerevisiae DSM 14362]